MAKKKKKSDYPVTDKDFDASLKLAGMVAAGLSKKFADTIFTLDPDFEQDSVKWAGICEQFSDILGNLEILNEMLPQFYAIAEKRMVKACKPKPNNEPLSSTDVRKAMKALK